MFNYSHLMCFLILATLALVFIVLQLFLPLPQRLWDPTGGVCIGRYVEHVNQPRNIVGMVCDVL